METKDFRVSKIDVAENLDALFEFDVRIAKASLSLLPLETKEKLLDFLTKEHNSETWVWKDADERFVGYLSIIDMPKESTMEILNLGVDPKLQGKGIGRQMMRFAEKMAAELGREKVTLVTNVKNLQAVGFYKKLGYKIFKEMPNYYGDGETRYLFEKTL